MCLLWAVVRAEYPIDGRSRQIVIVCAIALSVGSGLGCVTTAECDDVVECPSGEACYDFECKTRCDVAGASCPAQRTCEPCEQDDPSGQIDHCPDRDRGMFVCLDEDA
jgi:hypothetical protein